MSHTHAFLFLNYIQAVCRKRENMSVISSNENQFQPARVLFGSNCCECCLIVHPQVTIQVIPKFHTRQSGKVFRLLLYCHPCKIPPLIVQGGEVSNRTIDYRSDYTERSVSGVDEVRYKGRH